MGTTRYKETLLCFLLIFMETQAQLWMALGTQTSAIESRPRSSINKNLCRALYLHHYQRTVCLNYTDLMLSVAEGIRLGIDECQVQFKHRKWNCTINEHGTSVFGPIITTASRESAFISGIISAGVAFSVTESCAEGKSVHCRCDNSVRGQTDEGWRWGGCNRPITYGIWFSQLFIDQVEKIVKKRKDPRKIMNLHNNKAGREVIKNLLQTECKCHGTSGNCNLKTCWRSQPHFSEIGKILKEKYDSAHEMEFLYKVKANGERKIKDLIPKYKEYLPPSSLDFIYYEESPNYCVKNETLGIAGTKGRSCNITSSGVDGCELMCCQRGYNVNIVQKTHSCECKFVWCCKVSCNSCIKMTPEYTCK
ncbi:proto-oncogene Wnt-3-like precursor [Hydra vulgaris]|uniref:Protein Wnt n=2 Tax=Hydra vulgaris TaxID=6087 RepID=Q9GTJ9_HYDVU|nr:proto-oncogene Wnt-3-like precursor [Hydra vulgaris]AAG13666.1 secreted Wnt/Wingless signalling factor [Hydra vulgaris]